MIELDQYKILEQVPREQLDKLYYEITEFFDGDIKNAYVIGSYCFGNQEYTPNDIDIAIILKEIPDKDVIINTHNHFSRVPCDKYINIHFCDPSTFYSIQAEAQAPYYDLEKHKWHFKKPYESRDLGWLGKRWVPRHFANQSLLSITPTGDGVLISGAFGQYKSPIMQSSIFRKREDVEEVFAVLSVNISYFLRKQVDLTKLKQRAIEYL